MKKNSFVRIFVSLFLVVAVCSLTACGGGGGGSSSNNNANPSQITNA